MKKLDEFKKEVSKLYKEVKAIDGNSINDYEKLEQIGERNFELKVKVFEYLAKPRIVKVNAIRAMTIIDLINDIAYLIASKES